MLNSRTWKITKYQVECSNYIIIIGYYYNRVERLLKICVIDAINIETIIIFIVIIVLVVLIIIYRLNNNLFSLFHHKTV